VVKTTNKERAGSARNVSYPDVDNLIQVLFEELKLWVLGIYIVTGEPESTLYLGSLVL
jgi:hypothetical protein